MSKKYVPSFLKDNVSKNNSFAALADLTDEIPRFSQKKNEPVLINTSLPAKMAPVLPPATLASLTKNDQLPIPFKFIPDLVKENKPVNKVLQKPLDAADFPSLGKPATIALVQKTSFSELSKEWAKKQKEDEKKASEEKEKELKMFQKMNKERDDLQLKRMGIISLATVKTKSQPEEEEEEEEEEEDYSFPKVKSTAVIEEEEEYEYEVDGIWNQRKHRDELY